MAGSSLPELVREAFSDPVFQRHVGGLEAMLRVREGGVSAPAEDLLPVSEAEAGVNFRPAGGVRGQVAGSHPRRQPGTGTRQVRGGAVTLSLHPEVPGIQFVSPGYGLDIRQSVGWTAQSGIWGVTPELVCSLPIFTTFGCNG